MAKKNKSKPLARSEADRDGIEIDPEQFDPPKVSFGPTPSPKQLLESRRDTPATPNLRLRQPTTFKPEKPLPIDPATHGNDFEEQGISTGVPDEGYIISLPVLDRNSWHPSPPNDATFAAIQQALKLSSLPPNISTLRLVLGRHDVFETDLVDRIVAKLKLGVRTSGRELIVDLTGRYRIGKIPLTDAEESGHLRRMRGRSKEVAKTSNPEHIDATSEPTLNPALVWEQLGAINRQLDQLQAPVLLTLQNILDSLAGYRFATFEMNRELAQAVQHLLSRLGAKVSLIANDSGQASRPGRFTCVKMATITGAFCIDVSGPASTSATAKGTLPSSTPPSKTPAKRQRTTYGGLTKFPLLKVVPPESFEPPKT